ncbi:hypothetical protein Amet_2929 [Alkaliphilus metalliredigens QYMF]|uniref:DUF2953 domain-containing protein n=1 Tax=Alkaliphilus metalliredigens (strain QYMF) TaxID=293826 RepID=A6TSB1_ALKMQ|nr:DUF2953 domain-containing protein [Alkaliphilus metalliredigens]ABR49079.1 hypothetical protein Amet_2929 [Alkaliphilus metalliredigens QYMF]
MILLAILRYLLLFLLAILLLILIIPVDYHLMASKDLVVTFKGHIGWFWHLVKVDFTIINNSPKAIRIKLLGLPISIHTSGEERKTYKKKQESKKPKKKKTTKKKVKYKNKFPLAWEHVTRELLDVIFLAIKRVLHHLKPKKFRLEGVYGFDDPYYTGIILAITSSLQPLFNDSPLEITPSFGETKLEGELEVHGRIIVILFLWIVLQLTLSKPIRKILKILFIKEKEEKKHVN